MNGPVSVGSVVAWTGDEEVGAWTGGDGIATWFGKEVDLELVRPWRLATG